MNEAIHRVKAMAMSGKKEAINSKTDLLLRLFESEWFNEWMCLQYLYQNPQPGVEDYLCNKLLNMPEAAVERYLLQFVYLAVSRPGSALERTIIALCSKSFPIALKVHWLLLALCQDQIKGKHVEQLKDKCERAALEGQWEAPFRVTHLDPLSPHATLSPEASGMLSPILSPLTQAPINLVMASSPMNSGGGMLLATPGILTQIDECGEHSITSTLPTMSVGGSVTAGDGSFLSSTPIPPPARLASLHTPPPCLVPRPGSIGNGSQPPQLQEHLQRIREELGDGEGVTALLHRSVGGAVAVAEDDLLLSDDDMPGGMFHAPQPLSPVTRVRHDTYGATLDFMETLCEASSSLASISQEERQRALRHTLEAINRELDKTVRRDIAVWFPMGKRNERVLRITAKEAVLLNSREKAPFMLFVEVLVTEDGLYHGSSQSGNRIPSSTSPQPHLSPPLSQPNLPILPGASLASLQGTLTSMSPYLASLVGAGTGPQLPLPPPAPPLASPAAPQPAAAADSAANAVLPNGTWAGGAVALGTGAGPVAEAGLETDAETAVGVGANGVAGSSLVTSMASSSGLPCSLVTSTSISTRAPGAVPSVSASPRASRDDLPSALPSPSAKPMSISMPIAAAPASLPKTETFSAISAVLAGLAPSPRETVSVSKETTYAPKAASAPSGALAATLEAIQAAFRGNRESSSHSGAVAAEPAMGAGTVEAGTGMSEAGAGPVTRQSSDSSRHSATDVTNASSGSLLALAQASGNSVVIPHRRRQTAEIDFVNTNQAIGSQGTNSQGFSLAGGLLPASASPAAFLLPPGSQGGITSAAEVAAAEQSPTRAIPAQPEQTASVPELSGWASALSTLTRVLLPSSSAPSAPPTSPAPSIASLTSPQLPLPQLPMPEAAAMSAAGRSLDRRPTSPLTLQDMTELIQSGVIPAPPQSPGAAGPAGSFESKIAGALASLRGEAPLVRLQLRVLPAAHAAEAAAAAAKAAASGLVPLRPPRGSSPTPIDTTRRLSASGNDSDSLAGSSPTSLLTSGSAKALNLLSKIGLCTRPATDEEDMPSPSINSNRRWGSSTSNNNSNNNNSSSGGAAASAGTVSEAPVRLLAVSLEVAGGVNLAITSPYRKSRRTPSHEAISMVATQLKIYEMPPPLELGPPLLPFQEQAGNANAVSQQGVGGDTWDEEGEGGPAPPLHARQGGLVASQEDQDNNVIASMASFSSLALAAGRGGGGAGGSGAQPPAGNLLYGARLANGTGGTLATSNSAGLSFPQAAQVTDLSSPRLVALPTQQQTPRAGDGSDAAAATPPHNKVGGLPMVGGVVSAAAAAAPGVLSPDLSHPPHPPQVHQPSILSLAAGPTRPASEPVGIQGVVPAPASARDTREPTFSTMLEQPPQPDAAAVTTTQPDQQQPPLQGCQASDGNGEDANGAPDGSAGPGPGLSRSKAAGAALSPLQVGLARQSAGEQTTGSRARTGGLSAGLDAFNGCPPSSIKLDIATERRRREAWAVYGERWAAKARRIQRESPHGPRKGWALRCVIVKSGDDCRQELLAVQLIRTFAEIFTEASLPLWVRHYDVLVTSNKTALIEVVPDSLSIHTVKHRSPPGASLSDHFFAKWPRGTPECLAAQRCFTESLAAYSIICYLMQIKDRHNGNVLIDDEGHLVHIDFGFMLSNSPGGVNFEAAPFKLTRELLEVMDSNSEGKPSELFDYFKVLMIQGFLACRKHHDRLLLLVRMMAKSGLPCFKTGDRAVKALEKRLSLQLTELQAMQAVLGLISDSLDAWRTRQYDYYQRLLNGIL